ncbi:hypothetical protein [Priestia flexa]|uniref:hypothetical protein n=1 Tax=Priestia flexa TaxID=86664 RepID=UPI000473D3BE|nr:hypothetical protein [Priestia flexa]
MSEIKCLLCKCSYFNEVETDIDMSVDVYSATYDNSDIAIYNETVASGELNHRIYPEDREKYLSHEYTDVYKYSCENCGFIMSFSKEKKVENRYQEKKRKKKESEFDWTNFGSSSKR